MKSKQVHDLIRQAAVQAPDAMALLYRQQQLTYGQLQQLVTSLAGQFEQMALAPGARIAVYLPKQVAAVVAMLAASAAGCVFVPVNPLLKPAQVRHILDDSQASVLVTSKQRADMLDSQLPGCSHLRYLAMLEDTVLELDLDLHSFDGQASSLPVPENLAAILYTSGSTGLPKGVMLSQHNLLLGAASVNQYLKISARDRLMAVLPFSIDYVLTQLFSACMAGASLVLMD